MSLYGEVDIDREVANRTGEPGRAGAITGVMLSRQFALLFILTISSEPANLTIRLSNDQALLAQTGWAKR
jgi:hypothetical protein